jgi:hypothetical protein
MNEKYIHTVVHYKAEVQDNNQRLKFDHLHNIVLLILPKLFLPLEKKKNYRKMIVKY